MSDNKIRRQSTEWVTKRVLSLRGKKRTSEQKNRMSEAQRKRFQTMPPSKTFGRIPSKEERKRLSMSHKGHLVSMKTRAKISKSLMGHVGANKGCHMSDDQKEKMRQVAVKRIQNGCNNNVRGISGWFYSRKNQKRLHYRSHLERDWYIILEKQTKVKSYRAEPVSIPYIWNKGIHRYIPDLLIQYIDGSLDLVELKPEYIWNNPQDRAKWKAAKKWCERRQKRIRQFKVYGYKKLRKLA